MNASKISELMKEALKCLKHDTAAHSKAYAIVKSDAQASDKNAADHKAQIPRHRDLLDWAISQIDEDAFAKLKAVLKASKDHLHWQVDDGGYYSQQADVGEGYKEGNMHALLIGPENAVIPSKDFLLGFFLLAPRTLYRDHKHLAPEIYVTLTGPSGWRFGLGDWADYQAGSAIDNAPEVVHATRVYETPFLALFAWTRDLSGACEVVNAQDWADVEQQLERRD